MDASRRSTGVRWLAFLTAAVMMLAAVPMTAHGATGTVSGRVTGDGGVGLAGVEVRLWDDVTYNDYAAWTDDEGYFTFDVEDVPGGYEVTFDPAEHNVDNDTDYLVEYYDNTYDWWEYTPVHAGETGIDATLDQGGRITGSVTGEGGLPLEGVAVTGTDLGDYWVTGLTGAQGDYTIHGVPADFDVYLEFDPSDHNATYSTDYLIEYYEDVYTLDEATPVQAGAVVDAQLTEGVVLSGVVRADVAGAFWPIPEVDVWVEDFGSGAFYALSSTDVDGYYQVSVPPEVDLRVHFDAGNTNDAYDTYFASEYNPDAYWFEDAAPFGVATSPVTLDAALAPGARISGTVSKPGGGAPYSGCEVAFLVYGTGERITITSIEDDGTYVSPVLPLFAAYAVRFDPFAFNGGSAIYQQEFWDNATVYGDADPVYAPGWHTTAGINAVLEPASLQIISIAGVNRIQTAIEVSKKAFPGEAEYVVIATGFNWPDALGGAALAGVLDGPILLTRQDALPPEVLNEITRLRADKAIILGGTSAVSSAVEAALKAKLGAADVTRLGGANRYDTARLIAAETVRRLKDDGGFDGTAFVATGANFPDALGASPIAAARGWPIFLVNPTGLDAATISGMSTAGVNRALVLGGPTAVPDATEKGIATALGCYTVRLAGANRYETAVKVARWGVGNAFLDWNGLAIATGQNFPDALAGGVLQGRSNSVVLLTPTNALNANVQAALVTNRAFIREVRFLGGTNAVSNAVRTVVKKALE